MVTLKYKIIRFNGRVWEDAFVNLWNSKESALRFLDGMRDPSAYKIVPIVKPE